MSNNYLKLYLLEQEKLPSHNGKDYRMVYADRWKSIKERFDKQELYTSEAAQAYLDALLGEIVKANPDLQHYSIHCYFSRSYIPNASYIGEGIILFNMGLFSRLADEGQAVFVLCHEIAHCVLQHPEKSIVQYVETMNSDAVQSELRRLKKTEYKKNEQLEQLTKALVFDDRRHSRYNESEADSFGVKLMEHTSYEPRISLGVLALLDTIDTDNFDIESFLPALFDSKEYPFKKKWLHKETGFMGGQVETVSRILADSLKTHPSCKERIKKLQVLLGPGTGVQDGNAKTGNGIDRAGERMKQLQDIFRYEMIEYAYRSHAYSESLLLCLELLKQRPGDVYGIAHTGRLMNGLFLARKGHTLSRVTDLPSPSYPGSYNLLLQWIQNLYMEDMASISYNFLRPWQAKYQTYELFRDSYEQSERQIQQ
ncbi:MAG: M48 family metalloprotease [Bacteroidetes bacterium]|nr:M48 family metalloprotease [Bacteroidota bacterium]